MVALSEGHLDTARGHLERALATAAVADLPVAVATRHALALVVARAGELGRAIDLAGAALDDGRRLGDRHVEAVLENTLADLLHEAGRREESMAHLKLAVAIFAEVGGRPGDLEPEIWKLVEW
jgi:ATP/maltotriose-dependent transcriptional regulator MalT